MATLAMIAVITAVAVILVCRTQAFRDYTKHWFAVRLQQKTGLTIEIRDLHGNPLTGYTLGGIAITGGQGDILTAERLSVRFSIHGLMLRTLDLERIDIVGLRFDARRLDVASLRKSTTSRLPDPGFAEKFSLVAHNITIRDGAIWLPLSANSRDTALHVQGIDMTAGVYATRDRCGITIRSLTVAVPDAAPPISAGSGSIGYDAAAGAVKVTNLALATARSDVKINGVLSSHPDGRVDIKTDIDAFALADVTRIPGLPALPPIVIEGGISTSGRIGRLRHRYQLGTQTGDLMISGAAATTPDHGLVVEIGAALANFDAGSLDPSFERTLQGPVSGNVDLTLEWRSARDWRSDATVSGLHADIAGIGGVDIDARLGAGPNVVDIHQCSVMTPGGDIAIAGSVTSPDDNDERTLTVQLAASAFRPSPQTQYWPARIDTLDVDLDITAQIGADRQPRRLTVTVHHLDGGGGQHLTANCGYGTIVRSGAAQIRSRIHLGFDQFDIEAEGSVDRTARTVDTRSRVFCDDIATTAEALQTWDNRLALNGLEAGHGWATAAVSGSWKQPECRVTAQIADVLFMELPVDSIRLQAAGSAVAGGATATGRVTVSGAMVHDVCMDDLSLAFTANPTSVRATGTCDTTIATVFLDNLMLRVTPGLGYRANADGVTIATSDLHVTNTVPVIGGYHKKTIAIDRLSLRTNLGEIDLDGVIRPDGAGDIVFAANHIELDRIAHDMPLCGLATVSGILSGPSDDRDMRLRFDIEQPEYAGVSTDCIHGTLAWRGTSSRYTARAAVAVGPINVKYLTLPASTLDLSAADTDITFDARTEADDEWAIMLKGRIENWTTAERVWHVDTSSVQNKHLGVETVGNPSFRIGNDFVKIRDLAISCGYGMITTHGHLDAGGQSRISVAASDIQLARLADLNPATKDIAGRGAVDVSITGTPDAPTIDATFTLDQLTVKNQPLPDCNAVVNYNNEYLTINAHLVHDNHGLATISGGSGLHLSLTPPQLYWGDNGIDIRLRTQSLRVSSLGEIAAIPDGIDGDLEIDATVSGPVDALLLTGTFSIRNGSLKIADPPLTFEQLRCAGVFNRDSVEISEFMAEGDTEGRLSGSGHIRFENGRPQALKLSLSGTNLLMPYKRYVTARITPNLTLSGTFTAPILTGTVAVASGRINLDRARRPSWSEIRIVDDESASAARTVLVEVDDDRQRLLGRLSSDVTVTVPGNVWLKGRDINAELGGQVEIHKSLGESFRLTGTLRSIRGAYDFRGRVFRVVHGNVTFTGQDNPNPTIDIMAETTVKKVKIMVMLSGAADQLYLTLDSEPELNEAEILSYIIFGGPMDTLNDAQAFNAESAALAITGTLAAQQLKAVMGDVLLLDSISIDPGGDDIRGGTVLLGKYIAPKVYLIYQQGFTAEEPRQLRLKYELNRNFSVETTFGDDRTNGIDLIWDFDY